jgi:hypothetical protein
MTLISLNMPADGATLESKWASAEPPAAEAQAVDVTAQTTEVDKEVDSTPAQIAESACND